MKKKIPRLKTDSQAEQFMEGDLSDYIHKANFLPLKLEFVPKDKSITLRMSSELLKEAKTLAKRRGIKYQKLIREALEEFLLRHKKG